MAHDILLETGTNEVEFLEFYLKEQSFGVNVAKVKQLIRFESEAITNLPEAYPSVIGTLHHLNRNIPIVDLSLHLKREHDHDNDHQIIIITDFNNALTGFIVDGVNKIHRITWDQLQPVSQALEALNPKITGVVIVEDRETLILDFEYILDDINPSEAIHHIDNPLSEEEKDEARRNKRALPLIAFAEDSSLFRQGLLQGLSNAGYTRVVAFENGKDLFDRYRGLEADSPELPHLLLTDIEMPQLDGLTLCKKFKSRFPQIPVVVLSSLITEQMSLKCEMVGADANLSKKSLTRLLEVIDRLVI